MSAFDFDLKPTETGQEDAKTCQVSFFRERTQAVSWKWITDARRMRMKKGTLAMPNSEENDCVTSYYQ
jgi:hypothetical protein